VGAFIAPSSLLENENMPFYTIVNKETGEEEECMCSYSRLQKRLDELGPDWQQRIGAPALVTHTGNVINKTSGDWKNLMGNIKKHSGRGNNIKT